MKEATRQFYLSALGIDVWEARYPLPGAAPSAPRVEEDAGPVRASEPAVEPPVPPDAPSHPGAPRDLDQIKSVLENELPREHGEEESEIATLPAVDDAGPAESTLSLQACIWHGQQLSLAVDLGRDVGSETQVRLGSNIMKALGEPAAAPEFLNWPPFQNRALPGNDDAAFDRLVHQMIEADSSRSWVLLGPETLEILCPRLRNQAHEVRLTSEMTLCQLVSDADSKRRLWESIQRAKLNVHSDNGNG